MSFPLVLATVRRSLGGIFREAYDGIGRDGQKLQGRTELSFFFLGLALGLEYGLWRWRGWHGMGMEGGLWFSLSRIASFT